MRGYRIRKENSLWYFELMPMRNGEQCIGKSKTYTSKSDCEKAVLIFRNFVISNKINSIDSSFINLVKSMNSTFKFEQIRAEYIKDGEVIFKTNNYNGSSMKKNCKTIVETIYESINDFTNEEIKLRSV